MIASMTTIRERYDIRGAPENLITQWKDAPKLKAFLQEIALMFDEMLMKPLDQIRENCMDIDSAQGVWLDCIGKRFGIRRPLVSNTPGLFGFQDVDGNTDPTAKTFDQGLFNSLDELLLPLSPVGDEDYRLLIKMRVKSLISQMTLPHMSAAVHAAVPDAVFDDAGAGSVSLNMGGVSPSLLNILRDNLPKPAGIGVSITNTTLNTYGNARYGTHRYA